MAEAPFQEYPSYSNRASRKSFIVILFFVLLGLVIACLVGLYMLGSTSDRPTKIPSVPLDLVDPSREPTKPASPSATPIPLERGEVTLSVLNGSGIAGAGRTMSTYLRSVGYRITVIGDARGSYDGIVIRVKPEKEAYLSLIENDLKKNQTVASVSGSIDDTIRTDVEVIVGR